MNKQTRRSGFKITTSLITLLGSLSIIMLFAVLNGSLGFLSAMGVTIFGALGIAKVLGENIFLSYESIIALILLSGVVRGILRYFEQYSNHYIAFKLLAVLRDKIFAALRTLAPAKLESKKKGSIIAMITSDIETLEVFYAHTISPICIAVVVSITVISFVGLYVSPYLALIAFISYLCIGVFIPYYASGKLKESGLLYRKEFASFNAYFLDSIKGIKDILLHNGEQRRKEEVNKRSSTLLKHTKKMKHDTTRVSALVELSVSFFILLTLLVGIYLYISEMISLGKMIVGIVTIFGSFGPQIALSALPSNLTQTFASADRVLDLLIEKPLVEEITDGSDFEFETLEVHNLNFAYEKDTTILNNLSLDIQKGEIIGIVGASGCGKSTLLKLLLRFFKKADGTILYNGIDIEKINTSSLLDNVTMVSQSTYLFDETIEENLKIAKADASEEELIEACKKASIHDFICTLPLGYQTQVGALGDRLSAGEKQRIGLARAFLKGSDLILLDEPTSNVDSINEGIILKALKDQTKDKAIILVSHRESTMAIASRIYEFRNGSLHEQARI